MQEISYTTKVTIEVEVSHYGTEHQAIDMVRHLVTDNVPAVLEAKVLSAKTNYRLFAEPREWLTSVNLDGE